MADTHSMQLDLSKLSAITEEPQQQLYVLSFLSSLERLVSALDNDGASAHQLPVQRELLRIIQYHTPAPTRLIRNVAGRILVDIFRKGDRKLLYDTVNELLNLVNAGKDKDVKVKHAAVHCLGEVYGVAGDSAISTATYALSSLLKLLKNSSSHAGLRSSIFRAMGQIFSMVREMSDESISRDVWKQARNHASGDKAFVSQCGALQVWETAVRK